MTAKSPSEKHCAECGEVKPATAFYANAKRCKTCYCARVRANYQANRVARAEYERARYQRPERKAAVLASASRRKERHPEKARATWAVSNAIRDGRLIPQPCERCGAKAQAHHDDYSRPLDVRWLCFTHHREVHGQIVSRPTDPTAAHHRKKQKANQERTD